MTVETVYSDALALTADQRAKLARQLLRSLPTDEPPKGVPIIGRGRGMLVSYVDDDEHLKDFAEPAP